MNYPKIISWLSAIFVFSLTIISIILTYNALYDVALFSDYSAMLALIWPLTIDGALVVFSLSVVSANLQNDKTKTRWVMVGVYTAITILFNIIDGGVEKLPEYVIYLLPFIVRAVPPVSLVLSFETLMSMLRKAIKRDNIIKSLANLESEWDNERDKIESKRGQLEGQLKSLNKTIEEAKEEINRINNEMDRTIDETTIRLLPDNLPVEVRQGIVKNLVNAGYTNKAMAELLGVSEGTIKNDKKLVAKG